MKLIMESWRGFINEDERSDSILLSTAKTSIRDRYSELLTKLAKTLDKKGYPGKEIIDRYIDKKAQELVDANKKIPVYGTGVTPNDLKYDDIVPFAKSEMAAIDKKRGPNKSTDNDPMKIAIKMIRDGKTDADIDKVLTKAPHNMSYSEANLLVQAAKEAAK